MFWYFDVGVVVDRAALDRRHDRKPVGVEEAAFDGRRHLVPLVAGEEVELRAVVVAVLRLELDRAPRRDGCVMMLMTPPIAMLPYRLDEASSVISMRSTLSSGTRVQYTQPPNGSLNGMPSSSTSVRLWPLGPDAAQRHALRRRLRRRGCWCAGTG